MLYSPTIVSRIFAFQMGGLFINRVHDLFSLCASFTLPLLFSKTTSDPQADGSKEC